MTAPPSTTTRATGDIAAFSASFDDEQTHVLGGGESFVELGPTRDDKGSVSGEAEQEARRAGERATVILEPTPALKSRSQREATPPVKLLPTREPAREPVASVAAFRVAVVADGGGVRVVALRDGETAQGPNALLVPIDSASSEAIRKLLSRG